MSLFSRLAADPDRPPLRERSAALLVTLALHALLLALLLWLTPDILPFRKNEPALATFNMPGPKAGHREERSGSRSAQADAGAATPAPPKPPTPTPRPDVPTPAPQVEVPSLLHMSAADFAASDIGKIPGKRSGGQGNGRDAASVYGPGEGPGGAQLFNAEWYREPTNAELDGYLPAGAPRNGFGLIACQTIERYHVDHCRVLGEGPLGSGLGQAVRRAAWQFLVVPPRVNGRSQLGAWVRIRIDYREGIVH